MRLAQQHRIGSNQASVIVGSHQASTHLQCIEAHLRRQAQEGTGVMGLEDVAQEAVVLQDDIRLLRHVNATDVIGFVG